MMRRTLGGDRLGAGKRMQIDMKSYERSTHDLSYIWRSSMAAGTLVPFMSRVALPGDTWDIDLECDIKTHPTLGPLFGSYKIQLDVFCTPIRLYNSYLHNNKLNIGLNMASVKLPQVNTYALAKTLITENDQVNPSSLIKYLGFSGLGAMGTGFTEGENMYREINAVPLLTYWDIFKNYYANKQEEQAYVIHTGGTALPTQINTTLLTTTKELGHNAPVDVIVTALGMIMTFTYDHEVSATGPEANALSQIMITASAGGEIRPATVIFTSGISKVAFNELTIVLDDPSQVGFSMGYWTGPVVPEGIQLRQFDLINIDTVREDILLTPGDTVYQINSDTPEPYYLPWTVFETDTSVEIPVRYTQEGLAVKTYNSDLLNNWIETGTITNINTLSAVSTAGGSFTIDSLNLANKVYNLLNRVAASGGSYDDWIETVYSNDVARKAYTPMYMGGLIKELAFQEINSTAATADQPLGQLAGKGIMTHKHKGGKIQIKTNEHSYITGIISLTPRIDYSQGNIWDINLKTMDDFHKPELDEIGFQDLITEQMAWYGSKINDDGTVTTHSAGKQPAWLNYMTEINRTYGNFAIVENEMFMTLNRRYEANQGTQNIADITTYIDPTKFNFIFAETSLDSQNFWAQIGVNATVRRKMSAKLIPNL